MNDTDRTPSTKQVIGFKTEAQLVASLLVKLSASPSYGYRVETELDSGVGIADIVLYKRRPRTNRELQLLSAIPPRLAPLLEPTISNAISNCDDLGRVLGISSSASLRVQRQLQKLGLLNLDRSYSLASVEKTPFQSIVAVEAKLSDWKRALVQAYRNRQFADESWVVLDHRYYKVVQSQLKRFELSGTGLASIDVYGNLYIHLLAPSTGAMSSTKRWQVQSALAKRIQRPWATVTL